MYKSISKIELQQVNFSYDVKKIYEQDISAILIKGKTYLLKGKNGCGKSTLVDILVKIWKDFFGDIYLENRSIRDIKRNEIIQLIGLAFQKTPIFRDTIKNNITLGEDHGDLDYLVNKLMFQNDLSTMGRTLQSWIDDISSLSGGQAQKIGIMRTLYIDKPVYIFDEPTANLDFESKNLFGQLLMEKKENKIIIVISHDCEIKKYIDRIIEIKGANTSCT